MMFDAERWLFLLAGIPIIGIGYLVLLVGFLMKKPWGAT